jgi:hypothetical protein
MGLKMSVIMLNVVMPSVVALKEAPSKKKKLLFCKILRTFEVSVVSFFNFRLSLAQSK